MCCVVYVCLQFLSGLILCLFKLLLIGILCSYFVWWSHLEHLWIVTTAEVFICILTCLKLLHVIFKTLLLVALSAEFYSSPIAINVTTSCRRNVIPFKSWLGSSESGRKKLPVRIFLIFLLLSRCYWVSLMHGRVYKMSL